MSLLSCFAFPRALGARLACAGLFLLFGSVSVAAAEGGEGQKIELKKSDGGVDVLLDGELFTRYVEKSNTKPILYPVIGPNDVRVTRSWPIEEALPGEKTDHPHHRSFWFDHGDVNGVSYWMEEGTYGTIRHAKYVTVGGDGGDLLTVDTEWVDPDGKVVVKDRRWHKFGAKEGLRWIDFRVEVEAVADEVTFGDTKEGSFGLRVAGDMKVDAKKGGEILNANGEKNGDAWAKAAPWVDYRGPVGDKRAGILIMNAPESFRFPTYWHVRTYGLFAANPFGLHDFTKAPEHAGDHKMKKGDTFTLQYRVVLHDGTLSSEKLAELFEEYAAESGKTF